MSLIEGEETNCPGKCGQYVPKTPQALCFGNERGRAHLPGRDNGPDRADGS